MANTVQKDSLEKVSIRLAQHQIKNTLTKREQYAMSVLQGLLSSGKIVDPHKAAELSVDIANTLASELEKSKSK